MVQDSSNLVDGRIGNVHGEGLQADLEEVVTARGCLWYVGLLLTHTEDIVCDRI